MGYATGGNDLPLRSARPASASPSVTRAISLRMTEHPAASDRGMYSSDRLDPNGRGHAISAGAIVRRLAEHLHVRAVEPK